MPQKNLRRCTINCAFGYWDDDKARIGSRVPCEGFRVNRYFVVRKAIPKDNWQGWGVIHSRTGFCAAAGVKSMEAAVECARKLTAAYRQRWNFRDVQTTRGWTKAKAISVEYSHTFSAVPEGGKEGQR